MCKIEGEHLLAAQHHHSDVELFGAVDFLLRALRRPPTAYQIANTIAMTLASNGAPLSAVAPSAEPIASSPPMAVGTEYLVRGYRFNGGIYSTMANRIMNGIPAPTIWPKRMKMLSITVLSLDKEALKIALVNLRY
jgi:hypothetical protein